MAIFKGLVARFGRLSLKKKLLVIFVSLVLLFLFYSLISNFFKKPSYTTAVVGKSEVVELVSEAGTVISSGFVNIYSPTNGHIKDVFVKNGDEVVRGQKLFSVESSATEQEQKAAQANYLTAVATLNSAQATLHTYESAKFGAWDTFKQLAESDKYEDSDGRPKNDNRALPEFHIAQENWLAAEKKAKDQQVAISQAQAQVTSTWLLYQATQDATVKAMIDGTVTNLSVTTGNNVSFNSPLSPASPILLLTTPTSAEVVISLSEDDILKIKEGQEAKISLDAVDSKKYKGSVKRFDSVGSDVKGIIKYNVYLEITDADNLIRSGMQADVEIETNKLSDVLAVANSAVKPYQGGKAVRIPGKKKGEVIFVPIQIGVKGDTKTQILEGVTEGQTIIVSLANEAVKRSSPLGF